MYTVYLRLAVMFFIFFALHMFLYWSALRFFYVKDPRVKNLLFLIAASLSLSFILSRIFVRLDLNRLTRALYIASSVWAGLAINLVMAAVIGWLIFIAGLIAGRRPAMAALGGALICGALVFSGYGVWNAFTPVITDVEAEIKGLPNAWAGKRIVHISDVHLGVIHGPKYLRSMAGIINALQPDLIFITGDLFDGISSDGLTQFIDPLNELRAKDGVLYVSGNHENYIGIKTVLETLQKTDMRLLDNEVINMDGLQIIGISYPEFGEKRDILRIIRERPSYKKGLPTILLYHTPTNIAQKAGSLAEGQQSTYWSPEIDYEAAKGLGVNLQVSGHTHRGQFIPFKYLAGYLYKGFDYGLHIDGDFSVFTTSGLGTFGPPMRTGTHSEIAVIRLKPRP